VKHIYLIFIFFSLICYSQNNEENPDHKLTFGPTIGANISIIPKFLDGVKENNPRLGLNIGGVLRYQAASKIFIQTEVTYSQQGTNNVFDIEVEFFDQPQKLQFNGDFKVDYIRVPVVLRKNFWNNFYLGAGPYVSFLTKKYVNLYTDDGAIRVSGDFDEVLEQLQNLGADLNLKANDVDYGALLDFGYTLDFGITINSRYGIGLTNIIENRDENKNITSKNYFIAFGLEYTF
jgi:uncharacterized protein YwgA